MLNLVENSIVKQPTIFSDHCQIICSINNSRSISVDSVRRTEKEPQIETFNLPKQFRWDNNSKQNSFNTLNSDEFQSRLILFEETYFVFTSEGTDLATAQFTELLNEISLRSLKALNCPKNTHKKRSKKWFDKECFVMRRALTELSNKKHKNPYDENLRQEYHKARKNFKKLIKLKKTGLPNSEIDNLVKHKRNQKFWSYLKSINGNVQSYNSNELEVPIDKLYELTLGTKTLFLVFIPYICYHETN